VDDSAEHCDLYALMLEPTATVITASRGEEALAIADSEPLDAIVLDVLMPGMDGWEVCVRLKANPITRSIPVIMLTSLEGEELTTRAHQVGTVAVLMKPCPAERLALAIEAAIQRPNDPAREPATAAAVPTVITIPAEGRPVTSARTRRWVRKAPASSLSVSLDRLPAQVINISYGGLCLEVERALGGIPASFDIKVTASGLSIAAGAVWMSRGPRSWRCGAEVARPNEAWRGLVDAVHAN
jgi:CheY-like chemotaxis protein